MNTDAAEQPVDDQQDTNENVAEILRFNISSILSKLNIKKIYFIDDAVNLDTNDPDRFIGVVNEAIQKNLLEQLKTIEIKNAIDFNTDEAVLSEHIREKWEGIPPRKKSNYFKKVYSIIGQPEAINDFNETIHLKAFFGDDVLEWLTPNDWDDRLDAILQDIVENEKILVLFDQDLKLAEGRYSTDDVKGEDLILELKNKGVEHKVIIALFTHTVTQLEDELPKRQAICETIAALDPSDFLVLSKSRLQKDELFADGLKKGVLEHFLRVN